MPSFRSLSHLKSTAYDVIVVGLGAAGSATLYHLAKQGYKVLGIDAQPAVAHSEGSSHGESRIIRLIYQEHQSYVSLLQHAYQKWRALEEESGQQILTVTGCLNASSGSELSQGAHGHSCYQGAVESAEALGLSHEKLTTAQVAQRYPLMQLPGGCRALFDPAGGVLHPEKAIQAFTRQAVQHGASIAVGCKVRGWSAPPTASDSSGSGSAEVVVETENSWDNGRSEKESLQCRRLVLTPGAWLPQLVPELQPVLEVERQVVGWFGPFPNISKIEETGSRPTLLAEQQLPAFLIDDEEGYYYGFPPDEQDLVGKYNHLNEVSSSGPAGVNRSVGRRDEEALRACLRKYFPALSTSPMRKYSVCMFTNTPDGHFILDYHPRFGKKVVIGSACSGHGFKFAPVLGEILGDLAVHGVVQHEIGMHRLGSDRWNGREGLPSQLF